MGGSTDGTIEWARAQGDDVYVQRAPGLRNGYLEAWPKIRGEAVVCFSPDGNSIPEVIPRLVAEMEQGDDLVSASRDLDGAKSVSVPFPVPRRVFCRANLRQATSW